MKKTGICLIAALAIGAMGFLGYMALKPDKLEVSSYRIETQGKEEDIWCLNVTGMGDERTQQKLNQTIQTELRLWLKDYLEGPLDVGNSIDGYFIADRYLCVTGSYGNYGNRGPWKEYYCAVYDLKNGEKVYLDDLFEVSDDFAQAIRQYGKTWRVDLGEITLEVPGYENVSEDEIKGYLERHVDFFVISEDYLYWHVPIPLDKLEEFLKVPKWWKSKPGLEQTDIETVNREVKKYLGMTNREISELTGKDMSNYRDVVVFEPDVLFPCIRPQDLPFYFVCGDWWDEEPPIYLAFYEEAEEEYLELLGINRDMGFREIIETMETTPVVRGAAESMDGRKEERYEIELERDGLRYVFCSGQEAGYDFTMFIGMPGGFME